MTTALKREIEILKKHRDGLQEKCDSFSSNFDRLYKIHLQLSAVHTALVNSIKREQALQDQRVTKYNQIILRLLRSQRAARMKTVTTDPVTTDPVTTDPVTT